MAVYDLCDRCGESRGFITYLTKEHEKICSVCREIERLKEIADNNPARQAVTPAHLISAP